MNEHLLADLNEALPVLQEFLGEERPTCAIVLGSGLNSFADSLESVRFLPYADMPHMNVSTATGHKGRFALGRVPATTKMVLCMQGRLHAYEGNTPWDVAFPIWLMARAGVKVLITTNAAGAINPDFHVGDFCMMEDQINFTGRNPLVGVEPNMISERFVPMKDAFDPQLRSIAHSVAESQGLALRSGVYLGLLGPSFETPAEIRMFASWGADTVAMSVVEEVIAARHVGMRVFGMSLLTNMACGVENGDPCSDDIMEAASIAESKFQTLMSGMIGRIG